MICRSFRVRQAACLTALMLLSPMASADDPQPTQLKPVPETNAPAAGQQGVAPTPMGGAPIVSGQTWYGGWSGAYAPSGSYWHHVPGSNVPYAYSGYPGSQSWNGYWNYGTAYGYPGYTAYWHGWYTGPYYHDHWGWGGQGYCGACNVGPYWDYAYPTWSHHGWGYSAIGWGHGHWLRHRVLAPRYSWRCDW